MIVKRKKTRRHALLARRYPHVGRRPGYGTYVSAEAIHDWARVPIDDRFAWIEEMISLEASLPEEIREAHRLFREGKIGPARPPGRARRTPRRRVRV